MIGAPVTQDGLEWLPRDEAGRNLQRIDVTFPGNDAVYSYAWGGEQELALGDVVGTPRPPGWKGYRLGLAIVVNLRSGYEGPIRTITEFVGRGPQ